ncbi:MAG: pyridoxal-phosphate dependent enzyme [Verrucomicrobiota bacterium]
MSSISLPMLRSLQSAAELVHSVIPPTPQIRWPLFCQRVGAEVWVKHENHNPTGAFKVRGGIVYMEELVRQHPDVKGVVSATRRAD